MRKARRMSDPPAERRSVELDRSMRAAVLVYDAMVELERDHPNVKRAHGLMSDSLILMHEAGLPVPKPVEE